MSFIKVSWNNDVKQKCDDRENFEAVIALSTKKGQSNQMLV